VPEKHPRPTDHDQHNYALIWQDKDEKPAGLLRATTLPPASGFRLVSQHLSQAYHEAAARIKALPLWPSEVLKPVHPFSLCPRPLSAATILPKPQGCALNYSVAHFCEAPKEMPQQH
jgi:hypothetical protein